MPEDLDDDEIPEGPGEDVPVPLEEQEQVGENTIEGNPLKDDGPDDEPELPEGSLPFEGKPVLPEKKFDPLRVMEAALFLGNKSLAYPELALVAKTSVKKARDLAEKLRAEYASRGGSLEVVISSDGVALQVKSDYLSPVSHLSKEVDLSRKGTKMLSLIAKKGHMLQSELKRYFRGEIYAYIHELKDRGYITSDKHGATRLLKPTEKFKESFQMGAT
jgi:chromosome segregation and condensation protein ScpB